MCGGNSTDPCTRREVCDGLALASPGRWPPDQRNYPQSVEWLDHRVSCCSRKDPQEGRLGPDRSADRHQILGVAVGRFRRSRGRTREPLPALYGRKKKWRLASQSDPHDYLDDKAGAEGAWRSNYASIDELADKVDEVMEDQAMRGQVRSQFPNLVVASLGAQRKENSTEHTESV